MKARQQLLSVAEDVADLADDLYAEMQLKNTPRTSSESRIQRIMFKWPSVPSVYAPRHELADFAELLCWQQGDTSATDLNQIARKTR